MTKPPAPPYPSATLWGRVTDHTIEQAPAARSIRMIPHEPTARCLVDLTTVHIAHPREYRIPASGEFEFVTHCPSTAWTIEIRLPGETWTRFWCPTPGTVTSIWELEG